MRERAWFAVLATALGALACGGSGGKAGVNDTPRTDLVCMSGGQVCEAMHTDLPGVMNCDDGSHEVASCPASGVLATCTADVTVEVIPFHLLFDVYDSSSLSVVESQCTSLHGTWQVN